VVAYAGQAEGDSPDTNPPKAIELPGKWLLCNGAELNATTNKKYEDLFLTIQYAHGRGAGVAFRLPDYRGTFLRGVDRGSGRDPDAIARARPVPNSGNDGDRVGSFQDDRFQSHKHNDEGHGHQASCDGATRNQERVDNDDEKGAIVCGDETNTPAVRVERGFALITNPVASTEGDPRHGRETRPKNSYVNWIIKF
jgi:microcystin-dependent protein